jgi:hypothetical protein
MASRCRDCGGSLARARRSVAGLCRACYERGWKLRNAGRVRSHRRRLFPLGFYLSVRPCDSRAHGFGEPCTVCKPWPGGVRQGVLTLLSDILRLRRALLAERAGPHP